MARRSAADERQADIFGATLPEQPASEPQPPLTQQPKGRQGGSRAFSPRADQDASPDSDIDALAARLSPTELDELAAALSNDALAHLVLAAVRQLRRRLARTGGQSRSNSKRRAPALERAARQLAAELGGTGGGDDA